MLKYIFFLILFPAIISAQWAGNIGSTDAHKISKIAVDGNGNVFITGYFKGTADLDPGAGTTNLVSAGQYDIFFAKYNSSGNLLWAKSVGGASQDYGQSIAVDGAANVLITGRYLGTVDFDPGDDAANLTSDNYSDVFFAKYNSNGEFIWAKSVGGNKPDYGEGLVVDGDNNVYVTGYFASTISDFDPGTGITNLTSNGDDDIFFAKYNSSGDFIWAKNIGGIQEDHAYSIAVDGNGNVFITGYFSGTVDFDPSPGTSNITSANNNEVFFAKYDSSGEFVWAKSLVGTSKVFEYSVATNGNGNVYITGVFQGTADFDPGANTLNLTSSGSYDVYFAKYNSAGEIIWAKNIGGTSGDYAYNIAIDGSGNVYVTGHFFGTSDFDPGAGVTTLTSAGSSDVFFAKYNSNGELIWAKNTGGSSSDKGYSVAVDANENVYVTGEFTGTVDFDPGAGITNLTNTSGDDIFIAKYNSSGVISSVSITSPAGGESWNQNNSQNITWTSTGVTTVKIEFSSDGGNIYNTVTDSVDASAGLYNWTVPNTHTVNGVIKITDAANFLISDVSQNFKIKLTSPNLNSPADNATDVSLSPTLSWAEVTGADKYHLEVNDASDFSGTVIYDNSNLTANSKQIGGLTDDKTYFWRVTCTNTAGNFSDASSNSSFTTAKAASGQYTLITPPPNTIDASTSPIISWPVTNGANKYHLEVNSALDFSGTVIFDANVTSASQSFTGLSYNTTYYWRVTATSNVLGKSATTVYSFTTKLAPPTLISPADSTGWISVLPTLTWSKISGVTRYNLLMSTNYYFTTIVLQKQLGDTSYQLTTPLNEDTKYYWKASGVNSQGNAGEYSAPVSFTTGSVLPVEMTDFSASTSGGLVSLSWKTATEVNNFGFEVERKDGRWETGDGRWKKIGFVPGAGNSNSPNSYSFTDQPTSGMSFYYRLKQIDINGHYKYYDAINVVLGHLAKPELMQNNPNPFNPSTSIKFYIPDISDVSIKIYDMLGREVALLISGQTSAGYHIVYWNGRNNYGETVSSGIYLYRLIAVYLSAGSKQSFIETKKMSLLR